MYPDRSHLREVELVVRVMDPGGESLMEAAPFGREARIVRQVGLLVWVLLEVEEQPGLPFENNILPAVAGHNAAPGRSTLSKWRVGTTICR